MGNAHASVVPYQVYALADGHLIVATANDGQFLRLARLLGLDALADDPRLQDNAGRLAHRDEMNAALSAAMAVLTKAEMRERCEANNVPVGPINRLDEVFADPQVVARGMKVELSDGLASVRSPIIFSDASLALGRASPMHGEHDAEIRGAMGLPARA
jgi:crotonobetainyl-CoA:carnitine CoA-transferase CaiB-like acyl-CoA transferase